MGKYLGLKLAASILSGLVAASSFAATSYKVEHLPLFSGDFPSTTGVAIARDGTVVGTGDNYNNDTGESTAILWNSEGKAFELTPGGPSWVTGTYSFSRAVDINNMGQAVVHNAATNVYSIWDNGTLTPISTGLSNASVRAINDSAQLAGSYYQIVNGVYISGAFIAGNGNATVLPVLGTGNVHFASDINNKGQVVGGSSVSTSVYHAALWQNGQVTDLGVLPGDTSSRAVAINDAGQILVQSFAPSRSRAFVWDQGQVTEIGHVGELDFVNAVGLNNAGQVVGTASKLGTGYNNAFIWDRGTITWLNNVIGNVGQTGCSAERINDVGQVLVNCYSYESSPFRLTPDTAAVDVGVTLYQSATYSIPQNDTLTYTARVVNTGALAATGVMLDDVLPANATLVSATSTQGSCSGNPTVMCDIGTLAPGAYALVNIAVKPNQMGGLVNNVFVSANEPQAYTVNDSAAISITVAAPRIYADLGMTMVPSATKVKRRSNITFTMTITNSGPQTADAISWSEIMPTGLSFVSLSASQGSCGGPGYINPSQISCSLGSLASGASATVKLVMYASNLGTYTNKATVSASATDVDLSNNTASATITIVR